jgi:hypothetical protein
MPKAEVMTLNVDVILPADIRTQWQPSIDWALRNIEVAQQTLTQRVSLNLRYHDEDTEDLDALAYRLTHPAEGEDTCHAIIGPYHSSNANDVLRYAGKDRLSVIMSTCTSSELQRSNAFARTFRRQIETKHDITIYDLYRELFKTTRGSHISIYNQQQYGSVYMETMAEFLPE